MVARSAAPESSHEAQQKRQGPGARLRRGLHQLAAQAASGAVPSAAVLAHIEAAETELDAIEQLTREALAAVQHSSVRAAAEAARLESEVMAEREAREAAVANRRVAIARYEEALRGRDATIATLHGKLALVHGEAMALEDARDAARGEVVALTAYYEDGLVRRDAVILEMHEEIAAVNGEALDLTRERDLALERAEAAEAWNEDAVEASAARGELVAAWARARELSDALAQATHELREHTRELALVQSERDTYRAHLREAIEEARAGRLGELAAVGRPTATRAERAGTRRLARTTAELGRHGPVTGVRPRIEVPDTL